MNYNYERFAGSYLQLNLLWFIISYAGKSVSQADLFDFDGNKTNYLPILALGGQ